MFNYAKPIQISVTISRKFGKLRAISKKWYFIDYLFFFPTNFICSGVTRPYLAT
jgi:hypothetical protein